MIRRDGSIELGGARDRPPRALLWATASVLVVMFFSAELWVQAFYPTHRALDHLVYGGPFARAVDVWRPFTAAFYEPTTGGVVVALALLFLVVRELERIRGSRWVLVVWLVTLVSSYLGHGLGDVAWLGRAECAMTGLAPALIVFALAYARAFADRDVYPFLFLQVRGSKLGLVLAIIVAVVYDFRTLGAALDGVPPVSFSAFALVAGVAGGLIWVHGEPALIRRVALARALAEVRRVQSEELRRERLDAILAKVNSSGLGSLSRAELRLLRRAARAMNAERSAEVGVTSTLTRRASPEPSPLAPRSDSDGDLEGGRP